MLAPRSTGFKVKVVVLLDPLSFFRELVGGCITQETDSFVSPRLFLRNLNAI